MAETFDLEVATPERILVHEPAARAQIPAKDGYIGVLPDHAALLSELGIGVLSYMTQGHRYSVAIHGGYVEVLENHVRVLADVAVPGEEIDVLHAEKEVQQAQIGIDPALGIDLASAFRAQLWAQARLEAARETEPKTEAKKE